MEKLNKNKKIKKELTPLSVQIQSHNKIHKKLKKRNCKIVYLYKTKIKSNNHFNKPKWSY